MTPNNPELAWIAGLAHQLTRGPVRRLVVLTGAQYDEVQAALAAARQAAETHRAELVRAGAGRHAGAGAGVSAADGEASGGARARRRTLRWR